MKKIALILASGLAMAGTANATDLNQWLSNPNQGFYVSATANMSHTKVDSDDGIPSISNSKITPKIAVGYDFGAYRVELNYADLGKLKYQEHNDYYGDVAFTGKIKNLGVSAMYNFAPEKAFQPYLGARLMYTKFTSNASATILGESYSFSDSEHRVGFGALAGVEYRLDSNLFAGVNVEYDRIATNAGSTSAGVSIRYKF